MTTATNDGGRVVAILTRPEGEIRIAEREYMGTGFIDLRYFYKSDAGELMPTKKGVTLRAFELEKVADILRELAAKERQYL